MVGKVLSAMNREIRGLHEAAYLLALFTFLAQVLALIRDRVFAHFFGAGVALDAYFAAFRIPDLTFAFLTLFVSSFALIPLFERRGGVRSAESLTMMGSVLATFGVVSVVVSVLLFPLMPLLVATLFGGFSPEAQADTVLLSSIMLLQPIILGFSSIVASVIQSTRRFLLYALAPVFYNVGIILGALFFYPVWGLPGLAWGVVLGALLHLVVQVLPLVGRRELAVPRFHRAWIEDVRQVVTLSFPRALALGSNHVVLLAFASAASLSVAGSVAVVTFGFNLQSVPLAVVGVSYASALFPSLAALFARGEREVFVKEVWAAVRHIVLWITLAVALMIVLRAHIVRVVLGSGEFTWSDTRLTAAVLAGFVISLVAQAVMLIFSRAYYAAGRSKEPIVVNGLAALCASVFAYGAFLWFQGATVARFFIEDLFRIGDIPGTEVVALALAYSGVMVVAALVFACLFARRFGFEARVLKSVLFSFAASVIAGAATYGTLQLFGPLLPTETFFGIFAQGVAGGVVGILAWAATLSVVKNQEFAEVLAVWSRLVRRGTV